MIPTIVESRPMAKRGRPKSTEPPAAFSNVRISKRANELAREAGGITGEGIAAYVDRIVIERADADILENARRRVQEADAKQPKGQPPR